MKSHPAAELFPRLSESELVALKNDILAHQQEHPIIVWNDMIVDGRNRFRACEMLGRKPKIKEMQFADEAAVIAYIISTNMRRRHLTDEQRDQIGARLVTMQAGGDGGASPQNAGTVLCQGILAACPSTRPHLREAPTSEGEFFTLKIKFLSANEKPQPIRARVLSRLCRHRCGRTAERLIARHLSLAGAEISPSERVRSGREV